MFTVHKEELDEFNKWYVKHEKVCTYTNSTIHPAIGGSITWCFTPTGLGVSIIVKCVCGDRVDLTNYEDW